MLRMGIFRSHFAKNASLLRHKRYKQTREVAWEDGTFASIIIFCTTYMNKQNAHALSVSLPELCLLLCIFPHSKLARGGGGSRRVRFEAWTGCRGGGNLMLFVTKLRWSTVREDFVCLCLYIVYMSVRPYCCLYSCVYIIVAAIPLFLPSPYVTPRKGSLRETSTMTMLNNSTVLHVKWKCVVPFIVQFIVDFACWPMLGPSLLFLLKLYECPPAMVSPETGSIENKINKKFRKLLWKASEWESWLLYYFLPCFQDILPAQFLNHFVLFGICCIPPVEESRFHGRHWPEHKAEHRICDYDAVSLWRSRNDI